MSLTNTEFKSIMKTYDYRRTANKRLLQERLEKLYIKIPEILKIDEQISRASLDISAQILKQPAERVKSLASLKDILDISKQKKLELLKKYGYPLNYLSPIYDCDLCQDTGYVDNNKCSCLKQALIDTAYQLSNLKDILKIENFSTFNFSYYSNTTQTNISSISPLENTKLVYNKCKTFVNDFDRVFSNLILYGQAGLGKTFLCNCIAKEILDKAHTVVYLSAFQLFRLFETYRFNNDDNILSYEDIENLYTCDLLIIDDLGTEVINTFTSAELFNCLNTRLLNKKSIVISTNLEPSEWSKQYSTRIVSRILGHYTPIKIFGEDIRIQKVR